MIGLKYINTEPLTSESYVNDSAQVHTFIINFVSGNETAEAKIQSFTAKTDGGIDYQSLVDHYEGVRVHVIDITKVEATLKVLFYIRENKPHMWWEYFEKQLTSAFVAYEKESSKGNLPLLFVAYEKHEKRQVAFQNIPTTSEVCFL